MQTPNFLNKGNDVLPCVNDEILVRDGCAG